MSHHHAEKGLGATQLPLSHLCSVNKPNTFINLPLDAGRTATLASPSGLHVCPVSPKKHSRVVDTCNPSTRGVESGGSGVRGQSDAASLRLSWALWGLDSTILEQKKAKLPPKSKNNKCLRDEHAKISNLVLLIVVWIYISLLSHKYIKLLCAYRM